MLGGGLERQATLSRPFLPVPKPAVRPQLTGTSPTTGSLSIVTSALVHAATLARCALHASNYGALRGTKGLRSNE